MTKRSTHGIGVLLVTGAALWWSTGGLFIRSIHADPWTTIFWRSLFAFATMSLFIAIRKRGTSFAHARAVGWPGVVMALCFCGASSSYVPAVLLTSVANAMILQSLAPFVAALLGFLLMGERVKPRTWVAMLVSAFGVYIMVSESVGGGSLLGNTLGFAIAVFYGGAVVVTRYHREVQMLPAACLAALFSLLLSAAVLGSAGRSPLAVEAHELPYLAAFGALQLAGGMLLFTYGARLIPAAESALLSIIESVSAPIWVYLAFGEDPGVRAVLGGVIVLGTVIVHTSLDLRRRIRAAQPAAMG